MVAAAGADLVRTAAWMRNSDAFRRHEHRAISYRPARRAEPDEPAAPASRFGDRPGWLEVAEAGILYFGITLLPLLLVILLYQFGVIA